MIRLLSPGGSNVQPNNVLELEHSRVEVFFSAT